MKTIELQLWPTANCRVVSVEGAVPLFAGMGDLRGRAWFGVFKSLAVDVLLATSFTDRCIRGVSPSKRKIFPLHSLPVAIISMQNEFKAITADTVEDDVHTVANSSNPKRWELFVLHSESNHDTRLLAGSCAV